MPRIRNIESAEQPLDSFERPALLKETVNSEDFMIVKGDEPIVDKAAIATSFLADKTAEGTDAVAGQVNNKLRLFLDKEYTFDGEKIYGADIYNNADAYLTKKQFDKANKKIIGDDWAEGLERNKPALLKKQGLTGQQVKKDIHQIGQGAKKGASTAKAQSWDAVAQESGPVDADIAEVDNAAARAKNTAQKYRNYRTRTTYYGTNGKKYSGTQGVRINRQRKKSAQAYLKGNATKASRHLAKARRIEKGFLTTAFSKVSQGGLMKVGCLGTGGILTLLALMFVLIVFTLLGGGGGGTNTANLGDTERIVATYLADKGFSNVQIAAIMANIKHESGFKADSDEIMDGMFNYSYERACGLFQFTSTDATGGEYNHFRNWCAANGKDWKDPTVQLDWVFTDVGTSGATWQSRWTNRHTYYEGKNGVPVGMYERSDKKAADFLNETNLEVATYSWMAYYEGPAASVSHYDRRIEAAQDYLNKLNSGTLVNTSGSEVVERAMAEMGKPYLWGAVGPSSYDCSGLVSYALTGKHTRIGTTSTFINWPRITQAEAVPGDIVVNSHHTGIYIGDGKMIHAPHTGDVVKISKVHSDMVYVRYPG